MGIPNIDSSLIPLQSSRVLRLKSVMAALLFQVHPAAGSRLDRT